VTAGSTISAAEAARVMDGLTEIVARAARLILATPQSGDHALKADRSPVTLADDKSEAVILEGLAKLLPDLPVVSEEMAARQAPSALDGSFVLVDPLDGTREFITGRDEFTVNVALVSNNTPVAGIVAAPRQGVAWRGVVGKGAERLRLDGSGRTAIQARRWPPRPVAVVSRSHLDADTQAFVAALGPIDCEESGSAVKFCRIAEGVADIYPRLAPTYEWDVAAGHAIVTAAGGMVAARNGGPLAFGNIAGAFRIPAFVAWGDGERANRL